MVAVGTVRGGDTGEAVTLHRAGEALALAGAGDVDLLAGAQAIRDPIVGREGHAGVDHVLLKDALKAPRDDELNARPFVSDDSDLTG